MSGEDEHLEGELDCKSHEHDGRGLRVFHAAAAAGVGAQGGCTGTSRPLAALTAKANITISGGMYESLWAVLRLVDFYL